MNREFEKLLVKIRLYNSRADLKKIRKAFLLAEKAHQDQKRLSGEPFLNHPLMVASCLVDWKLDTGSIIAGLLHDSVEDGGVSLQKIEEEFGKDIAVLVDGVTKIGDIKFKGSKDELFVENLRKMIVVMAKDLRVVLIKLADRYHNMKSLYVLPIKKQKRIAAETLEIYAPLAERLGIGVVKGELEDLAFPYLLKREFSHLKKLSRPFYKNADLRVKKMRIRLLKNFTEEKIKTEIHGRKKHFYSLYKKLNREERDNDISRIHDLVALRVICNSVEDCYRILGIVHKLYKPVPSIGVRDFIAQPKPNGYQSIHTNVFGENGDITEIQIRTFKMHEEAEKGVAAHWQYSEEKTKTVSEEKIESGFFAPDEKIDWIKDLMAWQKEITDSKEFLNSLKFDALKERNFIFSPKGDVFDLPKDATPIDFAYAIHTWIGDHCVGARVDEKFVGLDAKLQSGQMVEIITDKNRKGPSTDWLEFAITKLARSRINRYVKKD